MYKTLLLLSLVILSVSCESVKTPQDYIRFVEDDRQGLRRIEERNDWIFKAQYKPSLYIYLQENKGQTPEMDAFQERSAQLKDWVFFNIYIRHQSERTPPLRLLSGSLADYNVMLNYFLTENKHNFILYTENDTLYPRIYVYENSYGLSPEDVFVVGFEAKGQREHPTAMTLQYDDRYLTNSLIKFFWQKEELEKEPKLNF